MRFTIALATLALAVCPIVPAAEIDALAISQNIRARHLPYGTILDPVFDGDNQVVSYTRCGDSAIWTGHYLAAESFRYAVTRSPDALAAVAQATQAIVQLIDITGSTTLARCYLPAASPYAIDIINEEKSNGIHYGTLRDEAYYWVGHTSRDQICGVFFGLAVAYDMVPDPSIRASVTYAVTRLLESLTANNWAVVMPEGDISTVFWGRPDQQLALLAIGRRVNQRRFDGDYKDFRFWYASSVIAPVSLEILDPKGSYFKFNLDVINLYNLIRLESSSYYRWWFNNAYTVLRRTIDDHGNAHFNMIDRALNGANASRDAQTRALLEQWLQRPRRDPYLDLRGLYRSCGADDQACQPVPVPQRIPTDFLWQRSPFQLVGGGSGRIEGPGIDYILPYWMARYYGVM